MRSDHRADFADEFVFDLKPLPGNLGEFQTLLGGVGGEHAQIFDASVFAKVLLGKVKNPFDRLFVGSDFFVGMNAAVLQPEDRLEVQGSTQKSLRLRCARRGAGIRAYPQ